VFATKFKLEKNKAGLRWFCPSSALSVENAFAVLIFQSRTIENTGGHNNSFNRTRN
jgi:hypothetical protein